MTLRQTGFIQRTGLFLILSSAWTLACAEDDKGTGETEVPVEAGPSDTDETTPGTSEPDTADDGPDAGPTDTADKPDATAPEADAGADGGGGFTSANSGDGGMGIEEPDAAVEGPTFNITGKLKIGNTLFLDSDGPNFDNPAVPNDKTDVEDATKDQSQLISSPSTVGGYLGMLPVLGDDGEPTGEFVADNRDVFRVSLAAGQTITLFVAEPPDADGPPVADLDLLLANVADGTIADDSQGIGDKEQVTAPVSGTYWVAVERYQDEEDEADDNAQAVYSLAVGIAQPSATQMSVNSMKLSSKYDFVEGEAIYKTNFGPLSAATAKEVTPKARIDSTGFQNVSLNSVGDFVAQGVDRRNATIRALKRLRKQPGVVYADLNYKMYTLAVPDADDPLLPLQWHYEQIDLGPAWTQSDANPASARGAGVVVAVIDTGVAVDHPDFKNADGSSQLTEDGYDFISDPDVAADSDADGNDDDRDSDPNDPGDARTPGDSSFHGSHCAGTIAAATDNGVGVAGVAPKAHIMPIRALGRGGGTLEDIRQAVLYAAGLENSAGVLPSKKADIISMSLGGPGLSSSMAAAVAAARAEGVIVIAAAGNSSTFAEGFSPAGEAGVITVSSVDFNRELAFYSNFGAGNEVIEIAAPGGDTGADENLDGNADGVISMVFKDNGKTQYAAYQGTSMACPHVAGVAALMKSIWPSMGPAEFEDALPEIVVDLGAEGRDPKFGHGLLNANKAVSFAQAQSGGDVLAEPVLSLSTTVLDFGASNENLPLAIANTGKGTLEITNVTASEAWITVDPGEVRADNLVSINRNGLEPGVNSGTITIESNGGTEVISVRTFVGEEPTGGNLGVAYVMVVNPKTGEAVKQSYAAPEDEYEFSLEGIPGGKYYLVAGTDIRDTFFVGNDGDAYGAFPLSQDPELICRFQAEGDPECPATTADADPDMSVTIPIEYLLDLGAEEQDVEEASVKDEAGMMSVAKTAFKKAPRIRRLK